MSDNNENVFWNADIEEIKKGYIELQKNYKCIICDAEFIKGRIYEIDGALYDANKATEMHIIEKHKSILNYLLNMNSSFTGVSEVQKQVLLLRSYGLDDKKIAEKLGLAQSTIRNHRYKLREKEKQARIFLSIMSLASSNEENLCDPHKSATTIDDRYNITFKERESAIKSYMDENGAIKTFPSKEKKKIIILSEIIKNFSKERKYSEKEVNRVLKRIYDDFATIRRSLIEYGFFDRTDDCRSYWIKE